jgi:predicted Abi (CAAX) family protease
VSGWDCVDPLESLAAAHPRDDVIVALRGPVRVRADEGGVAAMYITRPPLVNSGRYYGLVTFGGAADADPCVRHFNPATGRYDGPAEIVRMPEAAPDHEGIYPSTTAGIASSPLNADGWYVYGMPDADGTFVVQAVLPRALLRVLPQETRIGTREATTFVGRQTWREMERRPGGVISVLLAPDGTAGEAEALAAWGEGDRALVLHTFGRHRRHGGLSRLRKPVCFGHFAFGVAEVVRDPLSGEFRFDIVYHQIYAHNTRGVIAGPNAHAHYLGDRQFGYLGYFPVVDLLFKLDAVCDDYDFDGQRWSPLDELARNLEIMEARYRIGDGTGGAYVGPANNCTQDSNQTLYTTIRRLPQVVRERVSRRDWADRNPDQAERLERLIALTSTLRRRLFPLGGARADWRGDDENELASTFEDRPLTAAARAILTWRTILPRAACETIAAVLIEHGASAWVLGTSLVGGENDKIEPVPPLNLG